MRDKILAAHRRAHFLTPVLTLIALVSAVAVVGAAESPVVGARSLEKQKVIIDTDIGDDIDDAFAVALALDSPELDILGFTTTTGNTLARARILDRMLAESGRANIPVATGRPVSYGFASAEAIGPQRAYGEGIPPLKQSHPDASRFILEQIRRYPGEVTLIAIGPLGNVGELIDTDPRTFRKVKRVVAMGGWIGNADDGFGRRLPRIAEGNIRLNVGAAQKLFQSGVPIFLMPIDSTLHLLLDEVKRKRIFSQATALTNSLGILYLLWGRNTPVLFDPMAVGFAVNSALCPVQPMHITVDDKGLTLEGAGAPNAQVCLRSDPILFFDYYMGRVAPPGSAEIP